MICSYCKSSVAEYRTIDGILACCSFCYSTNEKLNCDESFFEYENDEAYIDFYIKGKTSEEEI